MIKVGCCGFPIKRKLYYEEYEVVEIQKTFYDPRNIRIFKKWREEAPEKFEFTIKAWQGVTHSLKSPTWKRYKGELIGRKEKYGSLQFSDEVMWAWDLTLEAAKALKADKIVVQLPPSVKWNEKKTEYMETLAYFVESGKRIIVEPRHKSWFIDEVYNFFKDKKIAFCVDPFKNEIVDTVDDIIYLRLHGIGGYRYRYSDNDLRMLKDKITKFDDKKDFYVMFNNVYMYNDSKRFLDILNKDY